MVAALVSLLLGVFFSDPLEEDHGYIEGVAILAAVLVVSLVASWNDFNKERQFRSLNQAEADRDVTVIRDQKAQEISIFEILVGDIVILRSGDQIPADGVVIDSNLLSVDESSMTGESDWVQKSPTQSPFLLAGTTILRGSGSMIVLAVGERTEHGILMKGLAEEKGETRLQVKLLKLATDIGKLGFCVLQ
ncbi:hypothetical protein GEMRC1_004327 [Eukaryota sp. GEM-RC1]